MGTMQCSGVLFDLDGVLIDSTPCVTRVWQAWAIEHGLDPEHVVHVAHGRRSIETIELVAPNLDAAAENIEVENRELADTEGLTVFPGALDLLRSLPQGKWTIVTSGTRPLATLRLQVGGLPVPERMVTADDVSKGKPNPEPYLKGAEILGLRAEDCVVIEDAPSGLKAANAAGCRSFGVPTTYRPEELGDATVLLNSLSQLRAKFDKNGLILLEW
jgi:mannitol-1-/sugar-/sorbitol-6-phosphatase